MNRFAKLAVAAAIATYVLIVVGGLVRATDSGLGCPDWPFCFGDWFPPAELHAWIEHSHRLVAAVAVGPLVAAVGLITLFSARRRDRVLLGAALLAGLLVVVQACLGGQDVIQQLRAELVTAHLAMALTVLALTITIADRAASGGLPPAIAGLPNGLVTATAAAVFAQMLLGSWVSGTNSGLAFADFPLMNGSLWPSTAQSAELVQVAHRALAVVVAVLVVVAARRIRRTVSDPRPRRLAGLAVVLVVVQIGLGAANVWSRLSALFVVPHLAVGAALWATLVLLYLRPRQERPPLPAPRSAIPCGPTWRSRSRASSSCCW